jgi:hypothetical protein
LDSSDKQCARELVAGEALECRGFESPSSICILKKYKSLSSPLKSAAQTPAAQATRERARCALGAQVEKDKSLSSPLKSAAQTPAAAIGAAEATRERASCALGAQVGAVAAQTNAPRAADAITSAEATRVGASFERSEEEEEKREKEEEEEEQEQEQQQAPLVGASLERSKRGTRRYVC